MSLNLQENIKLSVHTTLQIGGFARYFVEVKNLDEVLAAARFAQEKVLPILVLGGGSNLLVSDEGFSGVVIKNAIKGISFSEEGELVRVVGGAGEVFDEVIEAVVARGYYGLENLSSIPGTLGATPVQNVGAYGVEIGELVESVLAVNLESGEQKIFNKIECKFKYRDSFFKSVEGKKYFITQVTLLLRKNSQPKISYADLAKRFLGATPTVAEVRSAIAEIRSAKFPDWHVLGTAGSFFKNPIISSEHYERLIVLYPNLPHYEAGEGMIKIPLGYVLDKLCNLKGYRQGAVGLYEEQALVLVNYGGATAVEVKDFVNEVAKKVFQNTQIKIEPEVNFV